MLGLLDPAGPRLTAHHKVSVFACSLNVEC